MLDVEKLNEIENAEDATFTQMVSLADLDPRKDLAGLFLGPIHLEESEDLNGFNFERSNLDGADFSNVDLTGVNFTGASLVGVNVNGAIYRKDQFTKEQLGSMKTETETSRRPVAGASEGSSAGQRSMTKQRFIEEIANATGLSSASASAALSALTSIIIQEISGGGAVTLPGVGKIYARERPARMVRNPATGEQIDKPHDRVVKMTIAKALKDAVNE